MKHYPLHHDDARPMYVTILKDTFECMMKELEDLRKQALEFDLAQARIKELKTEVNLLKSERYHKESR